MSKAAELAALIGSGQAQGNRNIIINGAMNVAQRNTSVSSLSSTATYSTCDRWMVQYGTAGTFTESQSSTAPDGFANSLKLDCTTADASPGYLLIIQNVEGHNVQQIKKGTSNALRTVMSFHVRSNKTGTYQVNIFDKDNTRIVGASYTIDSANTWEKKSVTFPADTTGAFDDDNNNSLQIEWWLASGSTYNTGTLPTAWETRDNADRAAALNVAIGASTDDEFYITGVQFEIGDVATPFEHEDFGTTLAKCQRYYTIEKAGTGGTYKRLALGQCQDSTSAGFIMSLSTPLRGTPTLETSGNSNHYQTYSAGAVDTLTGILLTSDSDAGTYNHNIAFNVTVSSGLVAGDAASLVTNNNASYYLAFDAEL